MTQPIILSRSHLPQFSIARVFSDFTAPLNSIDFFRTGEMMIASTDDETIRVYDCNSGTCRKTINCKKYGVNLVKYTHHSESVICASQNRAWAWDESIRYLSLHDNRYLRFFKGHKEKVVSLDMSPMSDNFVSASLDKTTRFWDLRTNVCQGMINIEGRPCVSYDPQGLILALGTAPNNVKLYDIRAYEKGPFSSFELECDPIEWNGAKFSPDGKYLLLSTNKNSAFLFDSYSGDVIQQFQGPSRRTDSELSLEVSFTPDGQFVLQGSENGTIIIWNVLTGEQETILDGHSGPVNVCKFNPAKMMIASACSNLAFWLLDTSKNRSQQFHPNIQNSVKKIIR